MCEDNYGVATVSRIDKITAFFCKRALLNRLYSSKETHNLIDPTDRSHPIPHQDNLDNKIAEIVSRKLHPCIHTLNL